MRNSSLSISMLALSFAVATSADAVPVANLPGAPTADLKVELQKVHHAPYHYCEWIRNQWGRPRYACWWDERVRRRYWR